MDTSNLSVGLVIKNYPVLCKLISEPQCEGGSKVIQLKKWDRYFKFHKEGHKFIIDEVYENPIPYIKNRGSNHSVYSDYIKTLVKGLLYHFRDQTLSFSINQFLTVLAMVNTNYSYCKQNIKLLSNYINIEPKYIHEFFDTTHSNLQGALESALNQLANESLIKWHMKNIVCVKEVIPETEDLLAEQEGVYKKVFRDATDEEEKWILECERNAMDTMGKYDKRDVILSHCWDDFSFLTNQALLENYNIYYYFSAYKVIINTKGFEKDSSIGDIIDSWHLPDSMQSSCKNKLNSLVLERCKNNIQKRHDRSYNIEDKNDSLKFIKKLRTDDDYVEFQNQLVDLLLDRKKANILKDIKKN